MQIISNHKENKEVREQFFELARTIFDLDFEPWYRNGFWRESYQPHSAWVNGKLAANVSASVIKFDEKGKEKTYVQLGTVMTAREFEGRGLAKELIRYVLNKYEKQADGFYLYANDSVLDFYHRFGFRQAEEYGYEAMIHNEEAFETAAVPMKNQEDFAMMEKVMEKAAANSALDMRYNPGLFMFYLSRFMREHVFYVEGLEAYAVAQMEEDVLYLHQIFSENKVDVLKVAEAFGRNFRQVKLRFTPLGTEGFRRVKIKEEDSTLFVLGEDFRDFEHKSLMFPSLSHA